MDGQKEATLQISGMTCAACAARIEKGLKRLDGVQDANVNLALEKSKIVYDPGQIEVGQLAEKVESLGYQVPAEKAEFAISGMTCAACANRVEKRLNKLPGVKNAAVNFAIETAAVDYHTGAVSPEEMIEAVEKLGYKLEHFWLGEPGMTPTRFAQILASRGINGLLIGRLPPGTSEIATGLNAGTAKFPNGSTRVSPVAGRPSTSTSASKFQYVNSNVWPFPAIR